MAVNYHEGNWVLHEKFGIGKVGLSSDGEILVGFDDGRDEVFESGPRKEIPLRKLNENGFWLRRRDDHEAFGKLVNEKPVEALLAQLNDGIESFETSDIKALMVPSLIPESGWEAWRAELMKDVKGDARFSIEKNDKIVYHGELGDIAGEMTARFKQAPSLKEKQKIVREMIQLEQKGVPLDDMRETAISFFNGTSLSRTNKIGARFEALMFLEELEKAQYDSIKDDFFAELTGLTDEQAAVSVAETSEALVRRALLDTFLRLKPDHFLDIVNILIKRFKKTQRDWTLDALHSYEDGSYIKTVIDNTMSDIATNLQPFVWFFKTFMDRPDSLSKIGYDDDTIISAAFKTLCNMHMTSAFSSNPKEGISISREEDELVKLLNDNKKVFGLLGNLPVSAVANFASRYLECNALDLEKRESMVAKIQEKNPGIELQKTKADVVETGYQLTKETFDQFKAEYKDLVENKLTQATKDIATAREWGDISENAELTIAQEKQRMLLGRKNELERIFESCTIIETA
ncbi:MAG TPA: hypothetical protein PLQ76_00590 [bacterium]|nr:hypothetical protein [bacterium]